MRRVRPWERHGQCSWPFSCQRVRLGHERADVAAADCEWGIEPIEWAVESGDADNETKRGTAGKCSHARPCRCKIPVEQDRGQLPQRVLLPRQRPREPLEHTVYGSVVCRRRLQVTLQRAFEKIVELVVAHFSLPYRSRFRA